MGTDKTDNVTCEIIYDNLSLFKQSPIIASGMVLYWWKTCSLYDKQKNIWVLGNTRSIYRVVHDISHDISHDIMFNTRNNSGISALPCIIPYIYLLCIVVSPVISMSGN